MTRIAAASEADLVQLRALLAAAGLPDEVGDHPGTSVLVARAGTLVVGGGAVEPYGDHGLLRSLVVDPGRRGHGLGGRLTEALAAEAGRMGLAALYLLTETAAGFFAGRGFARIGRETAPAPVQSSTEFAVLCPDTAVAMARVL